MSRIKKLIDMLPLNEEDKINFYKKVKVSMINDVRFLQENIYIFLNSGETIRLMRGTEEIHRLIKKIEELSIKEILSDEKFKDNRKILWTNEEIEFLKKNYKIYSIKELSEILGKSLYQIESKKISLRLYKIKVWEDEEVEFLKKNKEKSLYCLSMKLNRSIAAIKAKKRKHKIT